MRLALLTVYSNISKKADLIALHIWAMIIEYCDLQ